MELATRNPALSPSKPKPMQQTSIEKEVTYKVRDTVLLCLEAFQVCTSGGRCRPRAAPYPSRFLPARFCLELLRTLRYETVGANTITSILHSKIGGARLTGDWPKFGTGERDRHMWHYYHRNSLTSPDPMISMIRLPFTLREM